MEDYYNIKISEGLNPNTVIKHHAIIRSALQWAVSHQYIRVNVADFARKPERVKPQGNEPYSVEEVAQLLNLTRNDPISVPIFLAAFYGLRRSEVLGLRWSAINFEKDTLTIQTTVVREKQGNNIVTVVRENTTKTEFSQRTLPLFQYTYQFLKSVYQSQRNQQMLCGGSYDTRYLDFVCVNAMGTLLQPDYVSQRFQKILELHGLRHIRYHDLRHSCATIMMYLGYSLKDIQTWLGHSNYNFTADTYVHSSADEHLKMADSLSEKLGQIGPLCVPISIG